MDNLHEKGSLLKKARQQKGISLEIVHEHTKIPLDALRALEEGYTIRTLSPFYQKGFLKIYAQYLECDLKEILGDFKPKEISSSSFMSSGIPSRTLPLKSNSFNKNFSFLEKLQDILTRDRLILLARILGVVFSIFIFFKAVSFVWNKISSRAKKPAVTQESKETKFRANSKSKKEKPTKDIHWGAASPVEEKSSNPQPQAVVESATSSTAPLAAASVATSPEAVGKSHKNASLSVRPKKNSWLQVKSDGTVVFEAILKKGVTETWYADHEIELSGKNISECEFEVNGKMIGILSRDERRAKKVIVTKNGLSVKK